MMRLADLRTRAVAGDVLDRRSLPHEALGRCPRAWDMLIGPAAHLAQQGMERSPHLGEAIVISDWALLVRRSLHQAGSFHFLEPVGEDVRGDPLGRGQELRIARFAGEQVAQDDERPAIADNVERGSDWARRAICGHEVTCNLQF